MVMSHLLLAFCRRNSNYQINKVVVGLEQMKTKIVGVSGERFRQNAFDSNLISKEMHLEVFQFLSIFLESVRNVSDFSANTSTAYVHISIYFSCRPVSLKKPVKSIGDSLKPENKFRLR